MWKEEKINYAVNAIMYKCIFFMPINIKRIQNWHSFIGYSCTLLLEMEHEASRHNVGATNFRADWYFE